MAFPVFTVLITLVSTASRFGLAGKKSVGLAGHVRPDGDCVGSTLGVYNYIRKYYPDVDVRLYLEPIPNIFKFLNFSSEIRSDYEESVVFDLFIAMDCGDEKRLGNAARYLLINGNKNLTQNPRY